MAANRTAAFKDPLWSTAWLEAALEKEQEKFDKCPVMPDMVPGYVDAQAWGYVVLGYFLVEESFKALLHVRGKDVPATHSLSNLYKLLGPRDRKILREFYSDYRASIGGYRSRFRFKSLYGFLRNLDGGENERGHHVGSFDWRYYLIEEIRSQKMPFVSVDYLHEIAFGCIQIMLFAQNGRFDPSEYIHSRRLRHDRMKKYQVWLNGRMNTDGWRDLGDRVEILWGPDHRGRYDLFRVEGDAMNLALSESPEDFGLPVIDKRQEIDAFDAEDGFGRIGATG